MKKLLLYVVIMFACNTLWAYDFSYTYSGKTLYYNIISSTNHTVEVTYPGPYGWGNYEKPSGALSVPSVVYSGGVSYSVTEIGSYAFSSCVDLTSVTIPNTVTTIADDAFKNCVGLLSVSIPNSVTTIDDFAFSYCSSLTSITIPSSVTYIGLYVFTWCSALTSISVDPGNTVFDSRNDCNAVIESSTNDLVVGCMNTTIPNTVTSISFCAFRGCIGLTSITISPTITYIGVAAFDGCSGLTSISVDPYNGVYDSRDNCNAIIKTATNELIVGCMNTIIPNTVSSIESFAFGRCSGLTSITIPNSVTSIGGYAFERCEGLTTVNLGSGLITIDATAFSYANLSTVTCAANNPPSFSNTSSYITTFGDCKHTIGQLIIPCNRQSYYSSWSSYFDSITCNDAYTMTLTTNNSSYGQVSGGGNYFSGSTATINATPYDGHYFLNWSDGDTCNPRTVQVLSDTSFTALFAPYQYTITLVSNNDEWGDVSGGGTFDYGTVITLHALPASHYHFDRWSDNNNTNPRSLTVTSDKTLTAFFVKDQHQVTTVPNNASWGSVSGSGTYDYGSTATLVAVPIDAHHYFSNWNDGVTEASRLITVLSDTVFTAHFSIEQHTVTVTSADTSMGFVTGDGLYDYNSIATVKAVPLNGYQFLNWSDGNTNALRSFRVTQDVELTAYFEAVQGIDEVQNSEQIIHVFPNPANNVVTLQLQGMTGNAQLTVTDMLGREVMCKQLQSNGISFSVADWNPDIYMLKIAFNDGSNVVRKLIVTH
ncbi:MAG: leucine-rich repeat protein [Bacteroidales bacterium]|nr:leucine-rich repeat protein [Bacteroidales bacterium]